MGERPLKNYRLKYRDDRTLIYLVVYSDDQWNPYLPDRYRFIELVIKTSNMFTGL